MTSCRQTWRIALVLCLVLAVCLTLPAQASAEAVGGDCVMAPGSGMIVAGFLQEMLGSRQRLIQVTTVAVILGIFFLQWRR